MALDIKKFVNAVLRRQRMVVSLHNMTPLVEIAAARPIIHIRPKPTSKSRPAPPQLRGASNM
ncbi:hypothetical protein [Mesorhizobium sp. 128a]